MWSTMPQGQGSLRFGPGAGLNPETCSGTVGSRVHLRIPTAVGAPERHSLMHAGRCSLLADASGAEGDAIREAGT